MAWAVDVTDHGAAGDGITNDTAALQSALDAAEGMWCVVPPGVYMTDRLWARPKTTVLIQAGATLKFRPQNRTETEWGGPLNIWGTETVPIEGVTVCGGGTVDGSKGTHTNPSLNIECIDIKHASGCVVRDVTLVDSESEGIDFDASVDCVVDQITARDCDGFGVHLSHGNSRIKVVNSLAINCGHRWERGGFDTHAVQGNRTTFDCTYMGCTAIDCYRGFWVKADRSTLVGCRSEGGTVNDLRISGDGTAVTGFRSKNSGAHGITIEAAAERVGLADVTVRTATQAGIRVLSGADLVSVTGAHITGCGSNGIHTSGVNGLYAACLVQGNASNPQIRDTGTNNTVTANG